MLHNLVTYYVNKIAYLHIWQLLLQIDIDVFVVLVTQIPQLVLLWWWDFPKLLTILDEVLNQLKHNLPLIYMIVALLIHSVCIKPFAFCRNWVLRSDIYKLNLYLRGFLEIFIWDYAMYYSLSGVLSSAHQTLILLFPSH